MRKSKKRQASNDTCRFWSLNYTRLRTKEVIEQAQNIAMNYMIDEINKAFKKITKNNIDYLHDKINQYYGEYINSQLINVLLFVFRFMLNLFKNLFTIFIIVSNTEPITSPTTAPNILYEPSFFLVFII